MIDNDHLVGKTTAIYGANSSAYTHLLTVMGGDPIAHGASSSGMLAHYFAQSLMNLCPGLDDLSIKLARRLSLEVSSGAVCVDLARLAEDPSTDATWPSYRDMQNALVGSPIVGVPGQFRPLILDEGRLYLARYWRYECQLAASLLRRAANRDWDSVDLGRLRQELDRCFPDVSPEAQPQKLAVALAVLQRFCVISGGPGTGKTSTVMRLLLALQGLHEGRLRIGLVAPTGKAASRLSEAISTQKSHMVDHPWVDTIPETAGTIHRLLGSRPGSAYFRHNRNNTLCLDVLVVDEASMIDLALMAKLVDALPEQTRLVLLGDRDQLSAVEAGSVFGDLCVVSDYSSALRERLAALAIGLRGLPASAPAGLGDCVAMLSHSFRFGSDSGIGRLARSVNSGDADAGLALLQTGCCADLVWRDELELSTALETRMVDGYRPYFAAVDADREPDEIFASFNAFRVLTALREGRAGAGGCNAVVEQWRRRELGVTNRIHWYPGRAVMIRRNDYGLRLFNGDIGLCLRIDRELRVCFESSDGGIRTLAPGRVPEHDSAFAMTVHKSQGSEFDRVMLLIPESASRVVDRPLAYTGITRARSMVELWISAASFRAALARLPEKASGLSSRLL